MTLLLETGERIRELSGDSLDRREFYVPPEQDRFEFQFIIRIRKEPGTDSEPSSWRGLVLLVPENPREALENSEAKRAVLSIDHIPAALRELLAWARSGNGDPGTARQ